MCQYIRSQDPNKNIKKIKVKNVVSLVTYLFVSKLGFFKYGTNLKVYFPYL